ncbi:MAG: porin family protein [Treponema sp.]|nr:porin family protein [Treponema sp.]
MKKILSVICLAVAFTALAFSEVTFGFRGFGDFGAGTASSIQDTTTDTKKNWGYGGSVFSKIPISVVENLYFQPEIGFMHNSIGLKSSKYNLDSTLSYNSIVMPVLINYGIPINQSFHLFVEGGPQVSFITGDLKNSKSNDSTDPDSRILFSAIAGIGASYAFSPTMALLTDLRYDLGFTTIKTENSTEGVIPRGLNFSAGFHVKF